MTTPHPIDDDSDESTRRIVIRLRDDSKRREGAATVWRALGGAS